MRRVWYICSRLFWTWTSRTDYVFWPVHSIAGWISSCQISMFMMDVLTPSGSRFSRVLFWLHILFIFLLHFSVPTYLLYPSPLSFVMWQIPASISPRRKTERDREQQGKGVSEGIQQRLGSLNLRLGFWKDYNGKRCANIEFVLHLHVMTFKCPYH